MEAAVAESLRAEVLALGLELDRLHGSGMDVQYAMVVFALAMIEGVLRGDVAAMACCSAAYRETSITRARNFAKFSKNFGGDFADNRTASKDR